MEENPHPPVSGRSALFTMLVVFFILVLVGACVFVVWFINRMADPVPGSYQAVLADLDGDGDLDAVLANGANEGRASSTVWVNQGGAQGGQTGHFADSGQLLGDSDYRTVAAGDLDGDGDLDLLLGNTWNWIELFANQGGAQEGQPGQFKPAGELAAAEFWAGPHPLALGDLDGDGDLDLVTGNCCGGMMMRDTGGSIRLPAVSAVWINQSTGGEALPGALADGFQPAEAPADPLDGTHALALGDLDGDGDLDAWMARTMEWLSADGEHHRRTAFRLWWNDGAGSFSLANQILNTPSVYGIALGDLDGDGDLDGLAATLTGGQVLFYQEDAAGQPIIPGEVFGEDWFTSVALGDLDGDGDLDALLTQDGQAQVWLNDGRGVFSHYPSRIRYSSRHAAALGDVDGDGDLDVFAARLAEDYQVWLNDGQGGFKQARTDWFEFLSIEESQ